MRDPAATGFLGPRENAIPYPQSRLTAAALHHAQAWRRMAFRHPMLGNRDHLIAVDVDDAQHGHLGHTAHLVEGAAGAEIDQSLVRHVLEQRLEADLLVTLQAEGARDLALAGRLIAARDEVQDLIAAGQTGDNGGAGFTHRREP